MNKGIQKDTLKNAYKPYDIVTYKKHNVGFICEVSVNICQTEARHQISYAIKWLTGNISKGAWFHHEELEYKGNLFIAISECSCHPSGNNSDWVKDLFRNFS